MTQVERRVGLAVGTGSIYRHFPSREALLQVIMDEELNRNREATAEARAAVEQRIKDPEERQVALYRQWLKDLQPFDHFFGLMLDDNRRTPALQEAIRGVLRSTGEPARRVPLDPYALAALGGYHLFSIMQGHPFEGIEPDEFVRAVVEMTKRSPRKGQSRVKRPGARAAS